MHVKIINVHELAGRPGSFFFGMALYNLINYLTLSNEGIRSPWLECVAWRFGCLALGLDKENENGTVRDVRRQI